MNIIKFYIVLQGLMVSIFLTTSLSLGLFVVLHILLKQQKVGPNTDVRNFVTGGATWGIVSMVVLLPNFWVFEAYEYSKFVETVSPNLSNDRLNVFIIVLFAAIVSEAIRYKFMQDSRYFLKTYRAAITFGMGMGIGEFVTKYLFFFDQSIDQKLLIQMVFLFTLLISHSCLTILILRADENTKFVMFAAFLRFFLDLSFVGSIGFENDGTEILLNLMFITLTLLVMTFLSVKTRKLVPTGYKTIEISEN